MKFERRTAWRLVLHLLRRPFDGVDDAAVHAGDAHRLGAVFAQGGDDFGVDLAGEDHHDDVERLLVGDAAALDHLGLDAELLGELGGLLAAAVDHDHVDADLRDQRDLLAEGVERLLVVGDLAADLHDEGLVLEPVDEGLRLAQEVQVFGIHISSERIAFWTWRLFSASS